MFNKQTYQYDNTHNGDIAIIKVNAKYAHNIIVIIHEEFHFIKIIIPKN